MFRGRSATQFYNEVCGAMAGEMARYTPQLFIVKDHKSKLPPAAFGSSVLMAIDHHYFLITAAHCVHEINLELLGFMLGNDFCTIGGDLIYYEPNEEVFNVNNSDIAVFKLHTETANSLKEKYKFMDWNKVALDHLSNESSKYLIFGYPASKTRKHFPTKQIIPEPLILRTIGVPKEFYIREAIDRLKTIVLYGDQKHVGRAIDPRIEELPELGGISGCGVWAILDLNTDTPKYQLVALITGEGGNKTVLYCSRIDHVTNILRLHFKVDIP